MLRKALIVEDDAATRDLLCNLVQRQFGDVDEAADGESAMKLLDSNDYAVVLLDLVLPKMSGADVLDRLFTRDPAILERIIVVTGLNIEEVRKLFPTVCNALPKPVIPQKLMASIQKCLRATSDEYLTAQ